MSTLQNLTRDDLLKMSKDQVYTAYKDLAPKKKQAIPPRYYNITTKAAMIDRYAEVKAMPELDSTAEPHRSGRSKVGMTKSQAWSVVKWYKDHFATSNNKSMADFIQKTVKYSDKAETLRYQANNLLTSYQKRGIAPPGYQVQQEVVNTQGAYQVTFNLVLELHNRRRER